MRYIFLVIAFLACIPVNAQETRVQLKPPFDWGPYIERIHKHERALMNRDVLFIYGLRGIPFGAWETLTVTITRDGDVSARIADIAFGAEKFEDQKLAKLNIKKIESMAHKRVVRFPDGADRDSITFNLKGEFVPQTDSRLQSAMNEPEPSD